VSIGQTVAEIWPFFDFSRRRPPPSWIFKIWKLLTVKRFDRTDRRRRAKFCLYRTNRDRDMVIFDFQRWRPPPSWIFKFVQIWRWERSRASNCVTKPNLVENGQTAADIWRYFEFSRWRPPPFWIFEICNFNGPTAQERRTASACKISLKLLKTRPRYGDFRFFQDGGRPPSRICYVCPTKGIWWSLPLCKIWFKSMP